MGSKFEKFSITKQFRYFHDSPKPELNALKKIVTMYYRFFLIAKSTAKPT